jgi:predicted metalloprotease
VIIDQAPATCGKTTVTSDTGPAYYCFLDNSILLPVGYITKYYSPIGNAAVAELIGELYGLHVAQVLGFYNLKATGKLSQNDIYKSGVCFSGAWLYTVYQRNQFQPGDLNALGKLFAGYAGNGTTAQDWVNAFDTGFQTGNPVKCIPPAAQPGPSPTPGPTTTTT